MINTSVSKNEETIQSGVVDYPIGFKFYFNPDRTPQLRVKIGDEELRFKYNFDLSEDKGSVVLMPTEEESWTLEGPEDFSWMTKWDGKDLLIERVVPFVQDSDYQLGRISSEQIERDFDLSVMRDQVLQEQITDNIEDVSDLYSTTSELRTDVDTAQDSADAAMAHSVAVEVRMTEAEKDIAINRNNVQTAQDSADAAMALSVAVEKRVSQNEKDIASNDKDITNLFNEQASHNERISTVETGKIDKNQGGINAGKYLRVGADGYIELTAQGGGGGSGGVEHDESLVGSGSAEFPLKVSKKLSFEKVSISDGTRDVLSAMSTNMARELFPDQTFFGEGTTITSQWPLDNPDINRLEFLTPITFNGWMPDVAEDIAMKPISAWSLVSGYQVLENFVSFTTKSSQTMAGALTLPELTVETPEGALNISVTAGVATIATNNGLDIASQTKFDTAPTTDDNTTWENALDTSLVRKAQVAAAIGSAASITIRNWQ